MKYSIVLTHSFRFLIISFNSFKNRIFYHNLILNCEISTESSRNRSEMSDNSGISPALAAAIIRRKEIEKRIQEKSKEELIDPNAINPYEENTKDWYEFETKRRWSRYTQLKKVAKERIAEARQRLGNQPDANTKYKSNMYPPPEMEMNYQLFKYLRSQEKNNNGDTERNGNDN
ncbi:uncharacterized protein LOC129572661 [Sitodiplosis mosellana]|uniref:uncharacterized protein LOC129572661 n=1 Tax=Sitodiplosis mosellana TaxID=263140 RepID=UPI00244527B0|nr:uncharacterized protein LOC129572661 [Sitodiplosis mosellana]